MTNPATVSNANIPDRTWNGSLTEHSKSFTASIDKLKTDKANVLKAIKENPADARLLAELQTLQSEESMSYMAQSSTSKIIKDQGEGIISKF